MSRLQSRLQSLLNTIVDRIFIINLAERTDKYAKMVSQMEKLGITNYERFDAIKPVIADVLTNPCLTMLLSKTWAGVAMGVVGCKLSHIEVIKLAKKREYKSILVLEDDANFLSVFSENLETIQKEINTLSDWDMLYLGANHRFTGNPVTGHIKRVRHAYTTSSYIIRQKIYDDVINTAPRYIMEIDNFYVRYIQNNYMVFAVNPNLIEQAPDVSDISGNYSDIEFKNC